MEQGREASGHHGERRIRKGSRVPRVTAGTVERGKNPEDGTDGSLATLVHRRGSRAGSVTKGHPT